MDEVAWQGWSLGGGVVGWRAAQIAGLLQRPGELAAEDLHVPGDAVQRAALEEGLKHVLAGQFRLQIAEKIGGDAAGLPQPLPPVGVGMAQVDRPPAGQFGGVGVAPAGEQFGQDGRGLVPEETLVEQGGGPLRVVAGEGSVGPPRPLSWRR
jgi:hypothetical protein